MSKKLFTATLNIPYMHTYANPSTPIRPTLDRSWPGNNQYVTCQHNCSRVQETVETVRRLQETGETVRRLQETGENREKTTGNGENSEKTTGNRGKP